MGKHFEIESKNKIYIIVIILVLILAIIGACIYFNIKNDEQNNNKEEKNITNNTSSNSNTTNNETNTNNVQNEIEQNSVNQVENQITNQTQTAANTDIINNSQQAGIEEKQQDTSVPNSEKAENIVASKRGNPSSEYYEAILQEGNNYRVTVRRKSDTNVITFYNVNVSTGEVSQE